MKLNYDAETDSLYIDLSSSQAKDSKEVSDGFVIDFDAKGQVTGIDIQHASERLDLETLETTALPMSKTRMAS